MNARTKSAPRDTPPSSRKSAPTPINPILRALDLLNDAQEVAADSIAHLMIQHREHAEKLDKILLLLGQND